MPTGYVPRNQLSGLVSSSGNAPSEQELAGIIGNYDRSRFTYDPMTGRLTDNQTGGSYDYSWNALGGNPNAGTDVATNLSDYNRTGQADLHYGPGQTPYYGFGDSAQGYNGGDAPNSGTFISGDPNAISDYRSHRSDVVNRGVASVGALVGGAALGGALSGGGAASGAQTFPLAASGPVTVSPLAGGTAAAASGAAGAAGMALSGMDWANIGTSILGLLGSREAGDQQADAANNAAAGLERADLRARADLEPFRQAGGAALNPLVDFVSQGPETELERTEGFTQIQNSAAANGKLRSGGTLKDLTEFNSMLNSRNRNSRFNELFNLATLGSNSASRQATNTLNTASQVGDLGTQAGNARAAGTVGGVNQLTNLFDNFVFMRALNQGN